MKITDRGYWVSKLYKYQSFVHAFQYALYFRELTFFSAANPNIYLGGLLDERKSDIYDLVPRSYVPKTVVVQASSIEIAHIESEFEYPVILKPNIGYKGYMVKKIDDSEQLSDALQDYGDREILIQEFLKEEREYSVMYYCIDNNGRHGITSLVEKHLPVLTGNGKDSLEKLIASATNPFLNKSWLQKKYRSQKDEIPDKGSRIVIDHIGNYSRGAKFENLNDQIDERLLKAVHNFLLPVQGFNFCRLDVKASDIHELKSGRFKLLEINGAKSEPLHIYDPEMKWWEVIRDIRSHWRILFRVVKENRHKVNRPSTMQGYKSWRSLKKMME